MQIRIVHMDTPKPSQIPNPNEIEQEVRDVFKIDSELIPDEGIGQELVPIDPVGRMPAVIENDEPIEEDAQFARDSLKNVVSVGNNAVNHLEKIALQTEHPRAYEVLSTLLKTVADASKDILELHKIKRNAKGQEANLAAKNTQINVFTGNTADLQKFIKGQIIENDVTDG
jgi:hypothetical protein